MKTQFFQRCQPQAVQFLMIKSASPVIHPLQKQKKGVMVNYQGTEKAHTNAISVTTKTSLGETNKKIRLFLKMSDIFENIYRDIMNFKWMGCCCNHESRTFTLRMVRITNS
jgi:hypothetical protein